MFFFFPNLVNSDGDRFHPLLSWDIRDVKDLRVLGKVLLISLTSILYFHLFVYIYFF